MVVFNPGPSGDYPGEQLARLWYRWRRLDTLQPDRGRVMPRVYGGRLRYTWGCGTWGAISSFSQDQIKAGWVLGAGAEWQVPTTQWRARLEYLYYGFDNGTVGSGLWIALPGGGALLCGNTPTCSSPYAFSNQNFQTVRLGISYAFGYAAVPAVHK